MRVVGVDEAGRGPVIGPLVMCGIAVDEKDLPVLKELGVKDSKLLQPDVREKIRDELVKRFKYHLVIIPPDEIDRALSSDSSDNLNWLEGRKIAECIAVLAPDVAYVDCPSTNIEVFSNFIKKHAKVKKLVLEHKADLNYEVVGAASIIAKTKRDAEIELLKKAIGIDFGSGYASDPLTKAFVEKHWKDYPDLFRKSWETYAVLKRKAAQKGLEGY